MSSCEESAGSLMRPCRGPHTRSCGVEVCRADLGCRAVRRRRRIRRPPKKGGLRRRLALVAFRAQPRLSDRSSSRLASRRRRVLVGSNSTPPKRRTVRPERPRRPYERRDTAGGFRVGGTHGIAPARHPARRFAKSGSIWFRPPISAKRGWTLRRRRRTHPQSRSSRPFRVSV